VVAGGDGTVHRLLPGVLAQGHELALLPCGTGNDTARAWGVHGLRWVDALTLARTAPSRATDVGEVQHGAQRTPFLSSLCVGFDGAVCERALNSPAWLRGMPRYLWATLAEIARLRARHLRVQADGVTVHDGDALFASTLNTATYGSGMPVCPGATIDDGRLNLLLAGRFGRVGALAMMPLLMSGQHLRHPRVRSLSCTRLQISGPHPMPVAADGEVLPAVASLEVHVRPGALQAVRP
jgi:diacylglycerol kinase family enzyme